MKKASKRPSASDGGHILGERVFAAITAVEGMSLGRKSRERLADMNSRKLSPDEQRSEIIRAYSGSKPRR